MATTTERRKFLRLSGAAGLLALTGHQSTATEQRPRRFERAKIVGVGGTGRRIVNQIAQSRLPGVAEYIGVDLSNSSHLSVTSLDRELQLGSPIAESLATRKSVQRMAWLARDRFSEAIAGADTVIIVVGMGGLAGTEIAPIVANRAFNSNSLTSSVVLSPFVDREALERTIAASRGLGVMSIQSDRMAHISNYNISRRLRIGLPLEQVLAAIDSEAIAAIKMFLVPPIGIGLSQ